MKISINEYCIDTRRLVQGLDKSLTFWGRYGP